MAEHAPGRYCKSCRYDLRGSVEPVCPECGQDFDPNDLETYFDPSRKSERYGLHIVEGFAIVYPLLVIASIKTCFLVNGLLLGRWPRQTYGPWAIHDSKSDSFIALFLGIAVVLLFFVVIPVFIISIGVCLLSIWMRAIRSRLTIKSCLVWLAIAASWGLLFMDIKLDPWGMWDWFLD